MKCILSSLFLRVWWTIWKESPSKHSKRRPDELPSIILVVMQGGCGLHCTANVSMAARLSRDFSKLFKMPDTCLASQGRPQFNNYQWDNPKFNRGFRGCIAQVLQLSDDGQKGLIQGALLPLFKGGQDLRVYNCLCMGDLSHITIWASHLKGSGLHSGCSPVGQKHVHDLITP
jgi:hypothetical protein